MKCYEFLDEFKYLVRPSIGKDNLKEILDRCKIKYTDSFGVGLYILFDDGIVEWNHGFSCPKTWDEIKNTKDYYVNKAIPELERYIVYRQNSLARKKDRVNSLDEFIRLYRIVKEI